ncbi:hypothetical protein D3C76_1158770 [compost metagenome]
MGLLPQTTQVDTQAVLATLATVERGNRPATRRLTHFQALHLLTRLLDMPVDHPPVTLGQTPKQHEQHLIVTQDRTSTQTLPDMRPTVQLQAAVHRLTQQRPQQCPWNAGNGEAGPGTNHCARPQHVNGVL